MVIVPPASAQTQAVGLGIGSSREEPQRGGIDERGIGARREKIVVRDDVKALLPSRRSWPNCSRGRIRRTCAGPAPAVAGGRLQRSRLLPVDEQIVSEKRASSRLRPACIPPSRPAGTKDERRSAGARKPFRRRIEQHRSRRRRTRTYAPRTISTPDKRTNRCSESGGAFASAARISPKEPFSSATVGSTPPRKYDSSSSTSSRTFAEAPTAKKNRRTGRRGEPSTSSERKPFTNTRLNRSLPSDSMGVTDGSGT